MCRPQVENYFNYFTEIEECFRRCRGTPSLLSTVDWAIIESWKEAGIPLEAVCTGIAGTFEKFARRPRRLVKINSLGYCAQEVMRAAEQAKRMAVEGTSAARAELPAPPFAASEIAEFLDASARALEQQGACERDRGNAVLAGDLIQAAHSLDEIAIRCRAPVDDLEDLERSLTAIEEKVSASLTRSAPLDLVLRLQQEVDRSIVPYRRTMTALQIESLERQFLKKRLFEHYNVPRLSLFYL
jgi:hypothetical protein